MAWGGRGIGDVARFVSRWPLDLDVDVNTGGLGRSRSTVNWTLRLMGRANLSTSSGARPGVEPPLPLLALFTAGDLVLSRWLGRTPGSWLAPRLVLDAADQAWWSRRYESPERVIFIGSPLATEAGIGFGALGLAVPLVNYTAMWAARRRLGLRTSPVVMTGQLAAVGVGATLAWFARRHDRAVVERALAGAEAQRTAGFVAGQNAVAAGADSVVDLLARTEPLLGAMERDAGRPVTRSGTATALHEWKAQMAVVTADHAAYLGTVLRSWERARQSMDLRADVTLRFDPAVGTTVVTDHQAACLRSSLDQLGLTGDVRFDVVDAVATRRPGRAFVAAVDDHLVAVPADPGASPPAFDPVPLMVAAGAASVATTALPALGGTPWWMATTGTAAGVAVATWVHRRHRAGTPVDPSALIDLLLVLHSLTASGIVTTRRSPTDPGGRRLLPQADGLLISAMLVAGFVSPDSGPADAAALVAKAFASVVPPLHLAGMLHPRHLRFGLLSPGASFIGTRGMAAHVEDRRDEILSEWSRAAAVALEAGFADGHRSVIDLVRTACDDARRRIATLEAEAGPTVDGRVLAEAERRLAEAERTLAAIDGPTTADLGEWVPTDVWSAPGGDRGLPTRT